VGNALERTLICPIFFNRSMVNLEAKMPSLLAKAKAFFATQHSPPLDIAKLID
jgi:hypothetical protein